MSPIIGTLGGLVRFDPASSTFQATGAPVPKRTLGPCCTGYLWMIGQAPDGTIWGWSESTGLSVLVEPST